MICEPYIEVVFLLQTGGILRYLMSKQELAMNLVLLLRGEIFAGIDAVGARITHPSQMNSPTFFHRKLDGGWGQSEWDHRFDEVEYVPF